MLLSFRKHFRFANVFCVKTFSVKTKLFRFGNTSTFVCKLKYFSFKYKNILLSFRKHFRFANIF